MRAGLLNQRIELQKRGTYIKNHETVENWSTYATVSAQKLEPKGDEAFQNLQTDSSMTMSFAIRYRNGVSTKDRVVWSGREFDIRAATNPDGRRKKMILLCREHESDGD